MPVLRLFTLLAVTAVASMSPAQEQSVNLNDRVTVELTQPPLLEPYEAVGEYTPTVIAQAPAVEESIVEEKVVSDTVMGQADTVSGPVITELPPEPIGSCNTCTGGCDSCGGCKGGCCNNGCECQECRGGCPCCLLPPGDMMPHYPYDADNRMYYYFRPYNWFHVPMQAATSEKWGASRGQPYSNDVFKQVYVKLKDSLD